MSNFKIQDFKGVIPALVTCFDEQENVDEARMRAVVKHLLGQGVQGLYLTGSTGETFLMTPEERNRVVSIVMEEAGGKVPVVVHVGDIGTKKSIALANHAHKAGADGISSVPPFYWKFSDDDIFGYYKDISDACPLPMIVYNIPLAGLVGYGMIQRLAGIEGVKGIKYTAATHFEMQRIKNEIGKDFLVYSGADEMAVSGLVFGADGIIGSFYNVIPELFIAINEAVARGDIETARKKQDIANKIIFTALDYDYIAMMKRMLAWMGVDAGYSRRPFTKYTAGQEEQIKERLRKIKRENPEDAKGVLLFEAL